MNAPGLPELLDTAVAAARLAGRHTLTFFNAKTAVEFKADKSPVTQADREAELLVRDHLLAAFPTHSVLGEEHGTVAGDPDYQWIIDPIDGTKSFIHGVPLYSTLVGLQVKGRPTVGVIYLPATDDIVFAATGLGCFHNDAPARVSAVDTLADALICCSDVTMAVDRSDAYLTLARQCKYSRTWGDAYGYYLVATGRAEVMLDPEMNPWDCAAIIPVIQEAGGWCSSWAGQVTIDGGDLFAANSRLAKQVQHVLER
ncbi:MAG TPA: histidinol-phosphatase [Tepidisphaeraceae bacterium]|jgi:histidinol phosphatase-like enzyme (inositol monophosphatase family)